MIGRKRALWFVGSTLTGLILVGYLLASLSLTPKSVFQSLAATPLWLLAVVGTCTFLNQIVGALKWRVAARHLAEPFEGPGLLRSVELTSLGSFFGQLIPVQLSTMMARWFLLGRDAREAGLAVRSTLFEQSCDLAFGILLALAGIVVVTLSLSPAEALAVFLAVAVVGLLAIRPILAGFAEVAILILRRMSLGTFGHKTAASFRLAQHAPTGVLLTLGAYSLLRVLLVAARTIAVIAVFAPSATVWLAAAASPAITLIGALPISPAGLGIAEWSWSAVLIFAGSSASLAALAALNIRLTNMIMLGVIVGALSVFQFFVGEKPTIKVQRS